MSTSRHGALPRVYRGRDASSSGEEQSVETRPLELDGGGMSVSHRTFPLNPSTPTSSLDVDAGIATSPSASGNLTSPNNQPLPLYQQNSLSSRSTTNHSTSTSSPHHAQQQPNAVTVVSSFGTPVTRQRHGTKAGKLFVGQVPAVCTEEMLVPLFQPYGVILEVKVMRDHQGRSKGCAWVRYETQAMAQAAIDALHQRYTIAPHTNPLCVSHKDDELPASSRAPSVTIPHHSGVSSSRNPSQSDVQATGVLPGSVPAGCSCFVGNLPPSVTKEKLESMFAAAVPWASQVMVRLHYSGQYGFVTFDVPAASEAARLLHMSVVDGQAIKVEVAVREPRFVRQQQSTFHHILQHSCHVLHARQLQQTPANGVQPPQSSRHLPPAATRLWPDNTAMNQQRAPQQMYSPAMPSAYSGAPATQQQLANHTVVNVPSSGHYHHFNHHHHYYHSVTQPSMHPADTIPTQSMMLHHPPSMTRPQGPQNHPATAPLYQHNPGRGWNPDSTVPPPPPTHDGSSLATQHWHSAYTQPR